VLNFFGISRGNWIPHYRCVIFGSSSNCGDDGRNAGNGGRGGGIEAIYVWCNSEAHSCNHCCSGEAKSITHSESVFVASGIQHAMRISHAVICSLFSSRIFFHVISQTAQFFKQVIEHQMSVFIFSKCVWKILHSKKNGMIYDQKWALGFMWHTHYFCWISMKPEFSQQILKKYSNIKFH
jgi:hypothetical protein